ncbi:hypothetical protein FA95DRAFT_1606924 [Auriscalpium vulgare]|uniref:Uncharacterized protein n=1 Tax=Auriscalpium vulgare TaxID=40419 RepID=A0ACB8RQI1_9AGAM|nr:hypothetical protein FA95DRAFT_1606924 [Auriscalpium vulgare]
MTKGSAEDVPPLKITRARTRRRPVSLPAPRERPPAPPPPEKDLPQHVHEDVTHLRYEAFKQSSAPANRMSSSHPSLSTRPYSAITVQRDLVRVLVRAQHFGGEKSSYSGLLHFLGRSRTPTQDGPRTMSTISAPILNTPAFGSSWASLVDKAALEGLPERERKRQEAIFELIATEAAYVRDLQLIVEIFYSSMINLLEPKAITVIFANVEDLLLTNT